MSEINNKRLLRTDLINTGLQKGRHGGSPALIRPNRVEDRAGFYTYVKEQGVITVTDGIVLWPDMQADGTANGLQKYQVTGGDVTVTDGQYVHLQVEIATAYSLLVTSEPSTGSSHVHDVRLIRFYPVVSSWNLVANGSLQPDGATNYYYPLCKYNDNGTIFNRDLIWPGGFIRLDAFGLIQNVP